MKKTYFAHKGEIVEHNVVLEDGKVQFIDCIGKTGEVIALDPGYKGITHCETFAEAKEARLNKIDEMIKRYEQEREKISQQEEPVKGKLKMFNVDE